MYIYLALLSTTIFNSGLKIYGLLTTQALMIMNVPGKDIQAMVRPPLPQIRLFPDRFGYGFRGQPGIDDVVTIDRVYAEPRVSWFSGGPAGFQAASRNELGGI